MLFTQKKHNLSKISKTLKNMELKGELSQQTVGTFVKIPPLKGRESQLVEKHGVHLAQRCGQNHHDLGEKHHEDMTRVVKSMVILREIPLMVPCLGWLYSDPCWRVLRGE